MKVAVIYARYSSDNQTEQSIDGQLHVCQDYAKRNDILILDTYIDRAMTGTNDKREAFQRMLKDSDKKAWDYILVYKLDRFSRNKYEMAIHRKHLKDNGVKILSAMENIPDSPEGILLESLLEGINQYYSEELSQKTRRGLRETRMKGLFSGGLLCYGYDKIDQKVVINEFEAKIVNQIFTDYSNGKRIADIVRDLNENMILCKKSPFTPPKIYYLLQNLSYIGKFVKNDVNYDIYPAIVPTELFESVQKKITANKYGKHLLVNPYLLKGKIFCECGNPLHSYGGTSRTKDYHRYYSCVKNGKLSECKNSIRKEYIEKIVTDALRKILNVKKNKALLINKITEKLQADSNNINTLKNLEREFSKTDKALKNILKAIEAGVFTETTKTRLTELETTKKELTEKLLLERAREIFIPSADDLEKYFALALENMPQSLVDLLLEKAVLGNDRLELYLKYPGKPTDNPYSPPDDNDNPDGTKNSDRGFLFYSYKLSFSDFIPSGRGKKRTLLNRTVSVDFYL